MLGDAAHVHSPMGGQGMNTGLQDAYNLAWKLALVVSGRAADALLDSYEAERMRVAQALLNSTDRAFRLLVSDNWLAGLIRTRIAVGVVAQAMRRPSIRRLAFLTLSQIGISYRDSWLSRNLPALPKRAPRAGDRFPWVQLGFGDGGQPEDLFARLDDTRFNLLVFGQDAAELQRPFAPDLLRTHSIPDGPENRRELARVGIPRLSFYLLRPDGHIGLAGLDLDLAALDNWFTAAQIRAGLGHERKNNNL